VQAELEASDARKGQLLEHLDELQKRALPSDCTECKGEGHCGSPDSGPCERCGGWDDTKRKMAATRDRLVRDAELARDASRQLSNFAADLEKRARVPEGSPRNG